MILWISGLFLLIVGTACEKESSKEESKETSDIVSQTKHDSLLLKNASPVEAFTYFGCKKSTDATTVLTKSASEEEEYIVYKGHKDGYLYIRHINATFNCCPDTMKVTAVISGNRLIVNEREIVPRCNCTCRYDLEYKIGPLSTQKYTLHIYKDALRYTEFSFTYNASLNSRFIIRKNKAL